MCQPIHLPLHRVRDNRLAASGAVMPQPHQAVAIGQRDVPAVICVGWMKGGTLSLAICFGYVRSTQLMYCSVYG